MLVNSSEIICVAAKGVVCFSCAAPAAHFLYGGTSMKKRIICLLLTIAVLLSATYNLSYAADAITEAQVVEKLNNAESIWPDSSG